MTSQITWVQLLFEKWVTGMHKESTLIDSTSPSATLECGKCIQYDRIVSHFDAICYRVKGCVVDAKKGGRNRTLEKATTGFNFFSIQRGWI